MKKTKTKFQVGDRVKLSDKQLKELIPANLTEDGEYVVTACGGTFMSVQELFGEGRILPARYIWRFQLVPPKEEPVTYVFHTNGQAELDALEAVAKSNPQLCRYHFGISWTLVKSHIFVLRPNGFYGISDGTQERNTKTISFGSMLVKLAKYRKPERELPKYTLRDGNTVIFKAVDGEIVSYTTANDWHVYSVDEVEDLIDLIQDWNNKAEKICDSEISK